ncbi:MAG: transposase [Deltaproteobacteria bacterium]|nr:transposase [Deltaproteobacteria bacterium]
MTLKELSARLDRSVAVFTRCRSRVLQKFLIDMVRGILKAQSVQLASIARGLISDHQTTARHLFKRLDRNLGDYDVRPIQQSVQNKQSALIDDNTLIYFDPSDLIKPFAKKMEALSHVADGSDEHRIKNGYPLLACIALKEAEHGLPFIVRMMELRHYHLPGKPGQTYTREAIIQLATVRAKAYLDLRINKRLAKKLFAIQAVPVELEGGKIDSPHPLYLIGAKTSGLTLYLLTHCQEISPESLSQIVQDYLSRWKVEEFIRFVKQQYRAEKFLVRDLGRIKNLFHLLFISLVILTRMGEFPLKFSKTRALLIKEAKRVFKIPQKMRFFLYTLAEGLSQLLKKLPKSITQLWKPPPKYSPQLVLKGIL